MRLRGPLGKRVAQHQAELRNVASAHGVTNIRIFGSVARGEESASSDIDLLVDLAPDVGLFGLARLQRELEELLDARVDLVPANDLKPDVAESARREAVPL